MLSGVNFSHGVFEMVLKGAESSDQGLLVMKVFHDLDIQVLNGLS